LPFTDVLAIGGALDTGPLPGFNNSDSSNRFLTEEDVCKLAFTSLLFLSHFDISSKVRLEPTYALSSNECLICCLDLPSTLVFLKTKYMRRRRAMMRPLVSSRRVVFERAAQII